MYMFQQVMGVKRPLYLKNNGHNIGSTRLAEFARPRANVGVLNVVRFASEHCAEYRARGPARLLK